MTPDQTIAAAVVAILTADRPAALPDEVPMVTAENTELLERPYLLARCTAGENNHPRLYRCNLAIETHTRSDEQDALAAGIWHQAATDYFRANPASLYHTLLLTGLRLRVFNPASNEELLENPRGTGFVTTWSLMLEIL